MGCGTYGAINVRLGRRPASTTRPRARAGALALFYFTRGHVYYPQSSGSRCRRQVERCLGLRDWELARNKGVEATTPHLP
eukprot:scaffold102_cov133-Isochrysis_galbana.AAC.3